MAREAWDGEAHQRWTLRSAHMVNGASEEPRGSSGITSVAVEHEQIVERGEVRGDIGARRLHPARHRDTQAVVLDVEEHRQRQGRGHRQCGPEAVRRHRRFAAERHADTAAPRFVLQDVAMIGDRLRPSRSGRVLRADVTRHRQHHATFTIRQVAHDADIATVAEAAASPQRAAEGVGDREAERKEQGARTIVRARRVPRPVEERAENDLCDVVTARGELVEHQVLTRHFRAIAVGVLLEVVEGARDQGVVRDLPPVEAVVRSNRLRLGAPGSYAGLRTRLFSGRHVAKAIAPRRLA